MESTKANKKRQYNGQAFEVERLTPNLGGEIHGIDLKLPLDEDTCRRVEEELIEHKVVFARDQFLDIRQHLEFGRMLGSLEIHPFTKNHPDHPEVIMLEYDADNPPGGADQWHSDATFRELPTKYTTLRCEVAPDLGGDTVFSDMVAVYEGLSDHIKLLVDGLEAVHDYPHHRAKFVHSDEGRKHLAEMEKKYPNPTHPVVRDHPVTGTKAIYVSPTFTDHIVGMKPSESRAILDLLFEQTKMPEYQFRVRWVPGTITMWDNASVQHYASNDFYPHQRRMYRVSIAGDRPYHNPIFS
jgi:taurine dioxygenase